MGVSRWNRHSAAVIRTKRWKALRVQALRRDGWACVKFGAKGRLEVDHIQPVRTAYQPNDDTKVCASRR